MKTIKLLAGIVCVGLLLTGCISQSPNPNPPQTNAVTGAVTIAPPIYTVDTNKIQQIDSKIDGVITKVESLNSATASFNPYAVYTTAAITAAKSAEVAVTGIIALISGAAAYVKGKTAKVQTKAAATLARSTTNQEAIHNAPDAETAAAIAAHDIAQQKVAATI